MSVLPPEAMQAATSFLLGKTHGAMYMILQSMERPEDKLFKLSDLEQELRSDINKLYYPDVATKKTELFTRAPSSAE